jgi:hypothetical protein
VSLHVFTTILERYAALALYYVLYVYPVTDGSYWKKRGLLVLSIIHGVMDDGCVWVLPDIQ